MSKNNSGDRNSGDRNSGNLNSGNRNSGNWNSGNWNSGHLNSGSLNSGNRNSGDRNSGDWNSGDWNSGNWNSGYLNTNKPTIRMFNQDTGLMGESMVFPDYFYFDLTIWVNESEMTDVEKKENDQYKVSGGYLKTYSYKEAWRNAWNNTSDEDRRKTLELPNWNNEIFLEITGIDVEKELSIKSVDEEITLNGKRYKLMQ